MVRFLLPDALLVCADVYLPRHALCVEEGSILGIFPEAEVLGESVERFSGELWAAAPVLAHAHLEDYDFPSEDWSGAEFSRWAEALITWREGGSGIPLEASAKRTLEELRNSGCGLVAVHSAGTPAISVPDLEVAVFHEAPFPGNPDAGEWVPGAYSALHSPFLVEESLARQVFSDQSVRVSVHLGEHPEERRFLAGQDGPLADLMARRGRPYPRNRWDSPVDWLESLKGNRPGVMAVHCGDLDEKELASLRASGVSICWCPGTHDFFKRREPAFKGAGILPDAFGCDSRASNSILDPLRELRLAAAALPHASAQDLWRVMTEGGAASLGYKKWGTLASGRIARIVPLPAQSDTNARGICQSIVNPMGPMPLRAVEIF